MIGFVAARRWLVVRLLVIAAALLLMVALVALVGALSGWIGVLALVVDCHKSESSRLPRIVVADFRDGHIVFRTNEINQPLDDTAFPLQRMAAGNVNFHLQQRDVHWFAFPRSLQV